MCSSLSISTFSSCSYSNHRLLSPFFYPFCRFRKPIAVSSSEGEAVSILLSTTTSFTSSVFLFTQRHLLLKRMKSYTTAATAFNQSLISQLQNHGVLSSSTVAEVMTTVDRGLFVPRGNPPYMDTPVPIGYNATISAPHMHAICLELLKDHLQPGMRALDIGSGTGYLTACFAMMVGSQGRVVGVEHIPELVTSSIVNIKKSAAMELLAAGTLSMHVSDGRLGWPEEAPYDAIHVGAAAPEIPQALINQLKPGGRLVIPVGKFSQELQVIDKMLDGSVSIRSETSVRYVPLTGREAQLN